MTSVETLAEAGIIPLLLPFLAAAMAMDVTRRRIPNMLIVIMLGCGAAFQTTFFGADGFLASVGGMGIGLLILLPFYALGGMGAGDVKLLAAAGSFLGPWGATLAGAFTLCAGGILAVGVLAWRAGRALTAARYSPPITHAPLLDVRLPYSLAIAAGTFVAAYQLGVPSAGALLRGLPTW